MNPARIRKVMDLLSGLFTIGGTLIESFRKKDFRRVDEILDGALPTTVELQLVKLARDKKKEEVEG